MAHLPDALVIRVDAHGALVEIDQERVQAQLRGALFQESSWATRPVAVGDRVVVQGSGKDITIAAVLPRKNQFLRVAGGEERLAQVIATNVDQVVAMASLSKPGFSSSFVDRVLAGAEAGDIKRILILNKIDQADPEFAAGIVNTYRRAGVEVFTISATSGSGVELLQSTLISKTTVITGLSGVGKTTLINALIPGAQKPIGHISWKWSQGKHTTTAAELLHLPFGGNIIDTPGIRAFVPWGIHKGSLRHCFPDLEPLLGRCRFSDCQHSVEPGCALKAAVESGEIARTRVATYLELLDELLDPPEEWSEGARPGNRQ
ncbi:MAG: ribosome small subunit-dependent GTPase A [Planctomycetota bacterium]